LQQAQQKVAELEAKRSDAAKMIVKAEAANTKLDGDSIETATQKAKLKDIEAETKSAQAEVEAASVVVDGAPARLAQIEAELEKIQQDGRAAKAELEAATAMLDDLPALTAQKKAEVETLEAEISRQIAALRFQIKIKNISNDPEMRRNDEMFDTIVGRGRR
jgi:nitrate reductase NapAB chaperone NapD